MRPMGKALIALKSILQHVITYHNYFAYVAVFGQNWFYHFQQGG